jgi:hypothetical protein
MSRVCTSVNVTPSVTMNCIVSTLVLSTVGLYTSDSTPLATVNQTLDAGPAAVPTQSLRARSKCETVPGPSGAVTAACAGAGAAVRPATTTSVTKGVHKRLADIAHLPTAAEHDRRSQIARCST